MNGLTKLFFTLGTFSFPLMASAFSVDRIDPPHWWTGMRDTTLQLQVHGNDVKGADFSVEYPGVSIDSVVRLDGSPNWQFVYLNISPETKPGKMTLKWKEGKKTVKKEYELKARRPQKGSTRFHLRRRALPDNARPFRRRRPFEQCS